MSNLVVGLVGKAVNDSLSEPLGTEYSVPVAWWKRAIYRITRGRLGDDGRRLLPWTKLGTIVTMTDELHREELP